MDKRYQVFVSSTYADLKEERRSVTQAVMELECIPAGMELFPAADEAQFEFIKRVIDDCDYYLLIIAGRYGSTADDGISYTEKEYDYAVSKGLRVIALIHEDPESLPFSDTDAGLKQKLADFRKKVSTNRLVKQWKLRSDLPGLVLSSLVYAIRTYPAVGWVRANKAANEEVLADINTLRKQNEELRAKLTMFEQSVQANIPDIAGLDDLFDVEGNFWSRFSQGRRRWSTSASWREIFALIAPYLAEQPTSSSAVKSILKTALFKRSGAAQDGGDEELEDQSFRTIGVQLKALGLVNTAYTPTVQGAMAVFWSLTPTGEKLMWETRTVKKGAK